MIYQGTNAPFTISFDEMASELDDICVSLFDKRDTKLKHWSKEDVVFDGNLVICPIKQEESSDFTVGRCRFQIKFMFEGVVNFVNVEDVIKPSDDKCVLGGIQ